MKKNNSLVDAKKVFNIEIDALQKVRDSLDDTFTKILDEIIKCEGKVIVTGIGKPGHIAGKIAATLSSLGTHSFFCIRQRQCMAIWGWLHLTM